MKVLKNLSFLLFLSVLLISSCKKNDDIDQEAPSGEIPEVLINASINGTVVDEDGIPMENVNIQAGVNSTITDVNGVFSFYNIEVNQNGAVVSAEKDGYFNNTKLIITNTNKTSISKIMLIKKEVTSTFVAAAGGTTIMNGGAKVEFPANAIKLESGGAYSGNVNVYATWLDPTADDLSLRMPGDLRGTNSADDAVKLETYGMIGVELEGDNGESLNIAEGQTATIEVPVPASLLGSAPATIPLWHFDEATGYWLEEGEATLTSNNTYVGTVSHFSFWNYDIPYSLIHIEGTITDDAGNGISNLVVQISLNSTGETGYGYTDYDGLYEGYVPSDQDLTITVFDECGDEIYTADLGSFSSDAVIPEISIVNSASNLLTVTGVLHDCNNEIEPNGYVYLEYGQYMSNTITVNADGNFSGTVSLCDEMEVTISGISYNPFSQGTTTVHDITGVNELNVGTLVTCW